MNWKHLIWIIPVTFFLSLIFWAIFSTYYFNHEVYPELKFKESAVRYWACMDGCSNMEELIYGIKFYSSENQSYKKLHDDCAVRCDKQYFNLNQSLTFS